MLAKKKDFVILHAMVKTEREDRAGRQMLPIKLFKPRQKTLAGWFGSWAPASVRGETKPGEDVAFRPEPASATKGVGQAGAREAVTEQWTGHVQVDKTSD